MAEKPGEINDILETDDDSTLATRTDALTTDDSRNETTTETSAASTDEIATDPDEIREQIEDTRREMSETINEIQERLSFANISEQVTEQVSEQISGAVQSFKTTVSDATIGKAGKLAKNLSQQFKNSDVTRKIGANPAPLALVGFGLGLLLFKATQKKKKTVKYRYEKNPAPKNDVSAENNTLSDKAGKLYESVSNTAGSAYESASGTASKAYDKLGKLGGQLQNQYQQRLAGNPLAEGALALAAGAVIGAVIPLSEYENQLMGEARNQLLSQAQEAAGGTIEKVQQAIGQAKDDIVEEVKAQVGQQQ